MSDGDDRNQHEPHYSEEGIRGAGGWGCGTLGSIPEEGEQEQGTTTESGGEDDIMDQLLADFKKGNLSDLSGGAPFSSEHRRSDQTHERDNGVPHTSFAPRSVYDLGTGQQSRYRQFTFGMGGQAGQSGRGERDDLQTHSGDHEQSDLSKFKLIQHKHGADATATGQGSSDGNKRARLE
ncbi:hypothetical protein I302_105445 [Kwoniella bestiolae CBS 10118]|uniref:Uncharacterized protein n=1 Tax=Kwoniella bestiolae CBS 10118 TaxID=1296100 RepID=A0A1B9FT53_9TREE|nr:hypothetical protein I302_08726 [Kwoniella bestiolae CBS 10118]OCF21946.1 hypothetical protein I302_08726 [Kwoniella bestiolae CBS 10118]